MRGLIAASKFLPRSERTFSITSKLAMFESATETQLFFFFAYKNREPERESEK